MAGQPYFVIVYGADRKIEISQAGASARTARQGAVRSKGRGVRVNRAVRVDDPDFARSLVDYQPNGFTGVYCGGTPVNTGVLDPSYQTPSVAR